MECRRSCSGARGFGGLLDYPAYFDLLNLPLRRNKKQILHGLARRQSDPPSVRLAAGELQILGRFCSPSVWTILFIEAQNHARDSISRNKSRGDNQKDRREQGIRQPDLKS